MPIFRFIIVFWVPTRIGLHVLMLKKHTFSHRVQCCSTVLYEKKRALFLKHSVYAPVSLRTAPPDYPVCSDWSAHALAEPAQLAITEQLY